MQKLSLFITIQLLLLITKPVCMFQFSNNNSGRMNSLEKQFEEDMQNLPTFDYEFENKLSLLIASANNDELALSFIFQNALTGSLFEILKGDDVQVQQKMEEFEPEEPFNSVIIEVDEEPIKIGEALVLEDLKERDIADELIKEVIEEFDEKEGIIDELIKVEVEVEEIEESIVDDEFIPVKSEELKKEDTVADEFVSIELDDEFAPVSIKKPDDDSFIPVGAKEAEIKAIIQESTLEADLADLNLATALATEEVTKAENKPFLTIIGDSA